MPRPPGEDTNGEADMVFVLKAVDLKWKQVNRAEIYGTASAGVPPIILKYCHVS